MNKQLLKILRLLKLEEWNTLREKIDSSYPKKRPKKVSNLYETMHQHYKKEGVILSQEKIWARLYPDEKFSRTRLNGLSRKLLDIVIAYVENYTFHQSKTEQLLELLKRSNNVKYKKDFEYWLKIVTDSYNDEYSKESPEYWRIQALLQQEEEKYQRNIKGLKRSESLLSISDAMEREYLMQHLPYVVSVLNRKDIFKFDTLEKEKLEIFEERQKSFIQYIRERIQYLPDSIGLNAYYLLMEIYLQDGADKAFDKALQYFKKHEEEFLDQDNVHIRTILLNHVTKQIENKEPDAFFKYQKINKVDLFLENKKFIHFAHYINYVTLFSKEGLLEEAEEFMERYSSYVRKMYAEDVIHYCRALYYFYTALKKSLLTKDEKKVFFEESVGICNLIGKTNEFSNVGRYILLVRCYMELDHLGEGNKRLFKSHIDSAIKYFKESKLFPEEIGKSYFDFFPILQRIMLLPERKRSVAIKIREDIQRKKPKHGDWLLDKLEFAVKNKKKE